MKPLKLLDQVHHRMRLKHYSLQTERSYAAWIRRYILFHEKRHPRKLGVEHIEAFLSYLANRRHVSASTQNQAFNAIVFLYKQVLDIELDAKIRAVRAKRRIRVPSVLTHDEALRVIRQMSGEHQLIAKLLYGSGLRLMEAVRLRVKDIDFGMHRIIVRSGKGDRDRVSVLPGSIETALATHLKRVRVVHKEDLKRGCGAVHLPDALDRKYPRAACEWIWQYAFPSKSLSRDPRSGRTGRHHIHKDSVRKAVKAAAAVAGIHKRVSPHVFRHSFATQLLVSGYDIRTVQELLKHKDVATTMVYTHVLRRGAHAVKSPLD